MTPFDFKKRTSAATFFVTCLGLAAVFMLGSVRVSPGQTLGGATNVSSPGPTTTNAPAASNAPASQENNSTPDIPTAIRLYNQGKRDEALATLNSVLQTQPQNIEALLLRGAIYMAKQQWDGATKDYQAVLQVDNANSVAQFNLADIKFRQHQFDAARTAFLALPESKDDDIRDLISYKIYLCDLLSGHDDVAAKELDAFNQLAARPSYYFGNAAWNLVHKKPEEARTWLISAGNIYPVKKHLLYMSILKDMGYLPLPPAPASP